MSVLRVDNQNREYNNNNNKRNTTLNLGGVLCYRLLADILISSSFLCNNSLSAFGTSVRR